MPRSRLSSKNSSCISSPVVRVEVAGRLVGEQQRAARSTSARASATRCCSPPDSSPGPVGQAMRRGRRASSIVVRALGARRARGSRWISAGHHRVLERGELGQQVVELEDEADRRGCGTRPARPASSRVTSTPSKRIVPGGRQVERAEHVQQRRLADARRADHRDHLAGAQHRSRCRAAPRACGRRGRTPWSDPHDHVRAAARAAGRARMPPERRHGMRQRQSARTSSRVSTALSHGSP